jgi:Glycosyl transferases group 1
VPRRCAAALDSTDAVLCDMSYVPPVRGRWASKPWFMISHNLEYRLLEQEAPARQRFAGWMKRVEAQAPIHYPDIFAVTEEDQAFFRSHDPSCRLQIPIISCAVDARAYRAPAGASQKIRAELKLADEDWLIVFSGSGFGPNLEALERVRRFARERSEFLARDRVSLLVLGSMALAPSREGVLVCTGRVPEVVPYLAAADAGLNPITQGSGSNVKLFEYLAAGLPMISTRLGVRGTPLEASRDFLELDPVDFRGAIDRLLQGGRRQWAQFAHDAWQRHRADCDISEVVRRTVGATTAFPSPVASTLRRP